MSACFCGRSHLATPEHQKEAPMSATSPAPAVTVTTEVEINHAVLGYDAYHDWDSEQQAAFLAAFATELKTAVRCDGIFQISYIAEELRKDPNDLAAVRWLNDQLTEYLADGPCCEHPSTTYDKGATTCAACGKDLS